MVNKFSVGTFVKYEGSLEEHVGKWALVDDVILCRSQDDSDSLEWRYDIILSGGGGIKKAGESSLTALSEIFPGL